MKVKDLIDLLTSYPNDMEVVLFRPACEDYDEHYDPDFSVETTETSQLVID